MTVKNELTKEQLIEENEILKAKVEWFEGQFKKIQQELYGSKSEKTRPEDGQLNLFNEAEVLADDTEEEPTFEKITYERRKKRKSKEETLKDLPVEKIEYTLSEEERLCPHGHGPLQVIGQVITKEIAIKPMEVYVIEHIQNKYACRPCEIEGIQTPIMIAPKPKRAIPGSMVSSSTISYVANQKYTNGMPLYRQEQEFKRNGIELSRQTLANWMIKASQCFTPLFNRLHELMIKKDILHADESTLQVLKEPGKAPTSKSYMWLYRTGKYDKPIILYDYQPSRSGDNPKRFLEGFSGYLNVDGYAGYNKVPDVILVSCLAHARRRFKKTLDVLPKNSKVMRTRANAGLNYCNQLYKIESKIRDLSPEERYKKRLELSRPVLDDFLAWLNEMREKIIPKSLLGDAINYTLNQWDHLTNFLLDGRLEIDNNRAERNFKSYVVGRKGWLFSNTPKGAKTSAIIFSLVETAKENKLKPFNYLKYLLDQLPNIDINNEKELDKLLPWSDSIPDDCKLNK